MPIPDKGSIEDIHRHPKPGSVAHHHRYLLEHRTLRETFSPVASIKVTGEMEVIIADLSAGRSSPDWRSGLTQEQQDYVMGSVCSRS